MLGKEPARHSNGHRYPKKLNSAYLMPKGFITTVAMAINHVHSQNIMGMPIHTSLASFIQFSYDPNDYDNDQYHYCQAGIYTCAENIADRFTTRQGKQHEQHAQGNHIFHFSYFLRNTFFAGFLPPSPPSG